MKPELYEGGFGGSDGAARLAHGDLAALQVGAPIQCLSQLTLTPLIVPDKVTAHAVWLQMNVLRRELAGLPPCRQTLLHVTFGTGVFFPTIVAQEQAARPFCPTSAFPSLKQFWGNAAGMEDSTCTNIHAALTQWISSRTVVLIFS